ncbi:osmotically-inducible lipoprotein OsmE [Pseudomonas sp. NPDC089401]|uniref:osmotically-inducible lipoprotein OsmE n=1 Tax=Pseudomonas sp. NPDC089401 TaxID=3364462 RepID=UPI003810935E
MNTSTCALVLALSALAGCSSNTSMYRDQPLVAKVTPGMSKAQVEQIGGKPDAQSDRTVVPGSCYDYRLRQGGQEKPYSVSFDGRGKVDESSFMTCAEWSNTQARARQSLPSMGGMSGSGY